MVFAVIDFLMENLIINIYSHGQKYQSRTKSKKTTHCKKYKYRVKLDMEKMLVKGENKMNTKKITKKIENAMLLAYQLLMFMLLFAAPCILIKAILSGGK